MKKGFTLIELLAVIVILAIIALIASPIIIGLIEDARKEAFKSSAYGIVKAGEILYSKDLLNGTNEKVIFTYTDGVETSSVSEKELDYNGTKPKTGSVVINSEGKVAIAIHNGTYCSVKGYEESEVTLFEKTKEECKIALLFACGDIFIDERDWNEYATVQIGGQCWMAEDLRYDCSKEGYTNVGAVNSWTGTNNCGNQGPGYSGLLYQWPVAMKGSTTEGVQGLCPSGWHIPTDAEWTTLTNNVGENPGTKLKAEPTIWNGTDDYGFNALPAGNRYPPGSLDGVGSSGMWWTSLVSSSGSGAWLTGLGSGVSSIYHSADSQASGHSVRCFLGQ